MTFKNNSRTMDTKSSTINENKGRQNMLSILDLCTKDQASINKFVNNVQDAVVEDKVQSFHKLDENDQERMVGLLILALDEPEEWFCNLTDVDMIMRAFAKFMLTGKQEDRDYALRLFKANAIKHFTAHLEAMISTAWNEYQGELRVSRRTSSLSISALRVA